MKQIYIAHCYQKAYIRFMEYVVDYLDHPQKAIIEQRLEILKFYDEFGMEAAKGAFKKSRSTIFLWKQKLVKADGKLSILAPGNRAPKHKRTRIINPFVAKLFQKMGYKTRTSQRSHDQAVDVEATRESVSERELLLIQCKRGSERSAAQLLSRRSEKCRDGRLTRELCRYDQ